MVQASSNMRSRGGVLAVHVYVSEGRDRALISRLSSAGAAAGAALTNEFLDVAYHRAGLTLASTNVCHLEASVKAVCCEALRSLDLRTHTASHPRVGVVDHIACNPLGTMTCKDAGNLARRLGGHLGSGDAGTGPAIPVYFYGAAREDGRALAELRRSLGYFGGAARGEWTGLSEQMAVAMRNLAPDVGPSEVDPQYGAAVVGAVPWVTNYNLLLAGNGLDQAELMLRCRRIARLTGARGGGLAAVETMALPHEQGVEVACNLLDTSITPPVQVRACVVELAEAEGLLVMSDYFTNKQPEEVLAMVQAEDDMLLARQNVPGCVPPE